MAGSTSTSDVITVPDRGPEARWRAAIEEATAGAAIGVAVPVVRWSPLPGPQTLAFESPADVLFYGGAAGGGKSDLLLGLALTAHRNSIIFRREYVQLRNFEERARDVVAGAGTYNATEHLWRLSDGRRLEFGGVQGEEDVQKYQGRPHDLIGFDEAPQFSARQVRFLMGWLRTVTGGQRCRVVMAGNPPTSAEGQWIIAYFAPWLDEQHPDPAKPGDLRWFVMTKTGDVEVPGPDPVEIDGAVYRPTSRTFIPADVEDNPYLMATGYDRQLDALPEPLRSQMRRGDFKAGTEDNPYQVIPSAWIRDAQARWKPEPGGPMTSLGFDVARGGADKTVLAPRHGTWFGPLLKYPGRATPSGSTAAALAILALRDGAHINIDVIGVGASAYDSLVEKKIPTVAINFAAKSLRSDGKPHTDRSRKLAMRNLRAYAYWAMREALDPEGGLNVALPPDQELFADLSAPRWEMTPGGILVEDKDEIVKRIGRSPDCGDAVVLANLPTIPPALGLALGSRRTWGPSADL
jgi:Terminase large subunit, T4likevirus-type, N-terminal